MSDREPFEAARTAGLRVRHETREARAIRKQVAEEIARALEAAPTERGWSSIGRVAANECAIIARQIGAEETPS